MDAKIEKMNNTDKNLSTTGFSDIYLNASYAFMKNSIALMGFKKPLQNGVKKIMRAYYYR